MDGLTNNLLRAAAPAICSSLSVLFSNSLNAGKLPAAWKKGKIRAVHKRGRKDLPDNYRPISLLSPVCKILESIISRALYDHLNSNKLISSSQSGFRCGDSAALQLFRLTADMMSTVDGGGVAAAVFYDFRKAFDTVWHEALLGKLSAAGVSGSLYSWLQDFLNNRTQQVEVGQTLSAPGVPLAGVPQGSVLSPTLFPLYINSVLSVTSSPSNCFADDTSTIAFSSSVPPAQHHLQTDIDAVSAWATAHKLTIHPSKTVSMLFHHPRRPVPPLHVNLHGQPIAHVTCHKHLGITLSSSFSWSFHVDSLLSRTSSMLALLRLFRSHYHFSSHSLLRIFLAYIRPALEFGSIAWCGLSPRCCRRLEAVQQKALSICGFSPTFLPSLASRRHTALVKLFSSILSDNVPDHLSNYCSWPFVASATGRCLRNSSSIRLPRPQTSLLLSSPLYLAASAYNSSL